MLIFLFKKIANGCAPLSLLKEHIRKAFPTGGVQGIAPSMKGSLAPRTDQRVPEAYWPNSLVAVRDSVSE